EQGQRAEEGGAGDDIGLRVLAVRRHDGKADGAQLVADRAEAPFDRKRPGLGPRATPVAHDSDAVIVVTAEHREQIIAAVVDDDEQAIVHSPPPAPASATPARPYFTCCLKNPSVFFHASSAAALLKAAVFSSLKNA